jgi:hypothetical protein
MSNTVSIYGQATFNVGGVQAIGSTQLTYTMTGTNMQASVINVNTGSWTSMNTSSLANIKYMYAENVSSSSLAQLYVSTTQTLAGVITTLNLNDFAFIPLSGSVTLYVAASGSNGIVSNIMVTA